MNNRREKFKSFSVKSANAEADIALINQYSVKELTPEDVYCFSVMLCDNDIDRDQERFTDETLEALAGLFVGKTGISDHKWTSDRQIARLYRVEVETTTEKNKLGEPLKQLRGSAYMIKNEANQPVIDAIEGGILKEVSIGCSISESNCSVCKKPMELDWRTWTYQCETGHIKGQEYDGKICCAELEKPQDAYEFSFVAVPAQKNAGVTKGETDIRTAFEILAESDLSDCGTEAEKLLPKLKMALANKAEKEARAKILKENEKFLKKEGKDYDTV